MAAAMLISVMSHLAAGNVRLASNMHNGAELGPMSGWITAIAAKVGFVPDYGYTGTLYARRRANSEARKD
jgi:hypothetical protein